MRIEVRVKPASRKNAVLPMDAGKFNVHVTERAVEGRANEALRETLAEYFHVSKSKVHLVRGTTSRTKLLEIENEIHGL